jgi:type I restriction enzyme, S subunit
MKAGWKTKALRDVCQFSNGLWKGEKPPFMNVGVIRNTNFTKEGTLDDSEIAYLDVEAKELEKRRLQFGDVILEKSGGGPKQPVGRVALFDKEDGDFSFSNFTAALRVRDPNELDFRFLHKFLHWTYLSGVTEGMQSHSTGIRNLDGDAYKAIQIIFPPPGEQKRIVGILDEAFEGIATAKANAEKNLQNARALFESHLQSVFTQRGEGWGKLRLGELATFRNGINFTKSSQGDFVKIIGVKDFQNNYWAPLDNLETVTTEGTLPDSDMLKEHDLLFVRSNGNIELIGRCILVRAVAEKITHSGFTIRARLNGGGVMPKYLCHFLKSNAARREMIDSGIGTNIKSLNQVTLSALVIPVPPDAAQTRIVDQLEALDVEGQRLESLYQQKLAALEVLKKSVLHQAFTGNL